MLMFIHFQNIQHLLSRGRHVRVKGLVILSDDVTFRYACFFYYFVQFVVQLRQRRPGELLPESGGGVPIEVDVGHRVDGVVSEGPHVVGVGVAVGDVRVSGARGVEADRVAPRRLRVVGHVRRQPDVHGAAQRHRVQEAHHPQPALGLLGLRLGGALIGGGRFRHNVHLEAALWGAAALQRRFLSRHVRTRERERERERESQAHRTHRETNGYREINTSQREAAGKSEQQRRSI